MCFRTTHIHHTHPSCNHCVKTDTGSACTEPRYNTVCCPALCTGLQCATTGRFKCIYHTEHFVEMPIPCASCDPFATTNASADTIPIADCTRPNRARRAELRERRRREEAAKYREQDERLKALELQAVWEEKRRSWGGEAAAKEWEEPEVFEKWEKEEDSEDSADEDDDERSDEDK
jgi:hypothetical protein